MKLSLLAVILGAFVALVNGYALLNPVGFTAAARRFPRSVPIGCGLMLIATAWFVWNVKSESIADFESLKPFLCLLFIAVGLGTCIFVKDYLGARGLGVIVLLLAKLMVDTARWHESSWRHVIIVWAYVLVLLGMWFTVSPWRLRDLLEWNLATPSRLKIGSALRLVFGLFVIVLGVTVLK